MPSELERIIARRRREFDQTESRARDDMRLAYQTAIDGIRADLMLMQRRIDQARANGEDINPDWLRRELRYLRLLNQAEAQFRRFSNNGEAIIEAAKPGATAAGAGLGDDVLQEQGIDMFAGDINAPATEELVASLDRESPLRDVLDSHGKGAAQTITDELIKGLTGGYSGDKIVRNILKALGGDGNRARLEALTRTELMRSYRAATKQQYDRMKHLIRGYRWVAAKQARTCLACLAMDGKIFDEYPMKQHVNCRCAVIAVAKDSTLDYQTGEQWLKEQPESTVEAMFPTPEAYEAWKGGKITLSDFAGTRQNKTWGPSVYVKSWRQVAGPHGLPERTASGRERARKIAERQGRGGKSFSESFMEGQKRNEQRFGKATRKPQDTRGLASVGRV